MFSEHGTIVRNWVRYVGGRGVRAVLGASDVVD